MRDRVLGTQSPFVRERGLQLVYPRSPVPPAAPRIAARSESPGPRQLELCAEHVTLLAPPTRVGFGDPHGGLRVGESGLESVGPRGRLTDVALERRDHRLDGAELVPRVGGLRGGVVPLRPASRRPSPPRHVDLVHLRVGRRGEVPPQLGRAVDEPAHQRVR